MIRRATVKLLAKPAVTKGIPDAKVTVAPMEDNDGTKGVMVHIAAVLPLETVMVARLSLSPDAARDLGERLVKAANEGTYLCKCGKRYMSGGQGTGARQCSDAKCGHVAFLDGKGGAS